MAPIASMATPGRPDRVEEDVVNFWVQFAPPSKDSVTRAIGARRVGVGDDDMVGVVRIDGDGKIASGDPLLAEGQNRVLCIGEHADVSGGCDPDPARS